MSDEREHRWNYCPHCGHRRSNAADEVLRVMLLTAIRDSRPRETEDTKESTSRGPDHE